MIGLEQERSDTVVGLRQITAFQVPIIMMSQNRQNARDKHESVIDFAINYKAEQEIEDMQKHLHRIEANGVRNKEEFNEELLQIKRILSSIDSKIWQFLLPL